MATTWQGRDTAWLARDFDASITEDLPYQLKRSGSSFAYSVAFAGSQLNLPVEILMGGQRHGLGFLAIIRELDGLPLIRPALVQARYEWSPEKKQLLLAPGSVSGNPRTLDAALGVVLSPRFESRCLECHGQPDSTTGVVTASGKAGGVHCESCHGAGSDHVAAVNQGAPRQGIINPKRLSIGESIEICARCHTGLAKFSDPSPEDLLVANQVRALKSSECFLQSRGAISCTTCHDPHNDAADDSHVAAVCLGCHAAGIQQQPRSNAKPHAAPCPINASTRCVACHMPSVQMGPLHLVDHTIRVHPGNGPGKNATASAGDTRLRTEFPPVSEYLRMIVVKTRQEAVAAGSRIQAGEPFYQVARQVSAGESASIGGFLGRKSLRDLDAGEAEQAVRLSYGETSGVFESQGKWVLLQRLPRDFRWQAEQLEHRAEELAAQKQPLAAIAKAQEALMVYPHYLRALQLIGATFAANGNPKRGAEVLTAASHLYPNDAPTHFALGVVLELLNDSGSAAKAYRRAIELDEDFAAAYANLGLLSYSTGDWNAAIAIFRRGLEINPLSADLNYDLALALRSKGDSVGSQREFALAFRLDPSRTQPDIQKPKAQPGEPAQPGGH